VVDLSHLAEMPSHHDATFGVKNPDSLSIPSSDMTTQNDIMKLERQFWQAIVDMDVDTAISLLDEESVSVSGWGIHHFSPTNYKAMALSGDLSSWVGSFPDAPRARTRTGGKTRSRN